RRGTPLAPKGADQGGWPVNSRTWWEAGRTVGLKTAMAFALVLAVVLPAAAQSKYVVEDLGALPGGTSSVATGNNQQGDCVGWSNGQAGTRAFVFTDGLGMKELPGLPNRDHTAARDINDAGHIHGGDNRRVG